MIMKQIFLLLFLFPLSVFSQDWRLIDTTNEKEDIFIDVSSIKRNEDKVFVWIKFASYTTELDKSKPLLNMADSLFAQKRIYRDYTLYYEVYDCVNNSSCLLKSVRYNENDDVVKTNDYVENKLNYSFIVPRSIGDNILKAICQKYVYKVNDKRYAIPIEKQKLFMNKYPNAEFIETK